MPPAGALLATDEVPIVRLGTPNVNLRTNIGAITNTSIAPAVITKTVDYNVLPSDNQATFDNGGAPGTVVFALPSAVPGLRYSFVVVTPQMVAVMAGGGDSIAIGTGQGAAGGSVQSSDPYSFISLIVPNGSPGQWVASGGLTGTWNLN